MPWRPCATCSKPVEVRHNVREAVRCAKHKRTGEEKGGYRPDRPGSWIYKTAEYKQGRNEVLAESGRTCHYCLGAATTADHVIPISRGGAIGKSNLVACCKNCNTSKGDRTVEEWVLSGRAPQSLVGRFRNDRY